MHSNPNPDDKHVPMQHQADYNPPIHSNGGPVKPNNMPIMCEGPGPEVLYLKDGTRIEPIMWKPEDFKGFVNEEDLMKLVCSDFAIPIKYSSFVPKGKAILSDGKNLTILDLPQTEEPEKEDK